MQHARLALEVVAVGIHASVGGVGESIVLAWKAQVHTANEDVIERGRPPGVSTAHRARRWRLALTKGKPERVQRVL